MTPTRGPNVGPVIDTGTATPPAARPDTYEESTTGPVIDTGIGSPLASRADTLDDGTAFIPPLWR